MENNAVFLIPGLMALVVIRSLLQPIRLGWKLAIHGSCGFLCLWLVNTTACFTGVPIPINAVTVLAAGFLGVPGIALLLLLEVFPFS